MKKTALLFACLMSTALVGECCHLEEMYVFGNANFDQGNFTDAGAPLVQRPGGQMMPEILNNQLGLAPVEPALPGGVPNPDGNNFAFVGAAISVDANPPLWPPSIPEQVGLALLRDGSFDCHQLFLLNGGGNDFTQNVRNEFLAALILRGQGFAFDDAPLVAVTSSVGPQDAVLTNAQIAAITQDWITSLNLLHDAGAEYLVTSNLSTLFDVPLILNGFTQVAIDSEQFAQVQDEMREAVNALPFDVVQTDLTGLIAEIVTAPRRFGFTNTTDACYGQATSVVGPTPVSCRGFFFFDDLHFTDAGNRIWADYVFNVLEGPNFAAALSQAPHGLIIAQQLTVLDQLDPCASRCPCTFEFFVSGGYSPYLREPTEQRSVWTQGAHVSAGGIYQLSSCLAVGAAASYSYGDVNIRGGDADLHLLGGQLFGQLTDACYYLNAVGSVGALFYDNIDRCFDLGPAPVHARGSTNGVGVGATLQGSYWVWECGCTKLGPTLLVEYQHAQLDGYTEKDAGVANLSYRTIERDWAATGIGVEAIFNLDTCYGCLCGYANGLIHKQWIEGCRDVFFNVTSMAGSHGKIPAIDQKDELVFLGNVGVRQCVCDCLEIDLGYHLRAGEWDTQYHTLTLGLSWKL